ncbi:MAG: alpha/beta fold hydrolase [Burkholderiaceae bacterium]
MNPFEALDRQLLPGFQRRVLEVGGSRVLALTGGSGPPLLMLHGDPQTHLCWHRIAPHLASRFTVVLTDIRGRGETHQPPVSPGGSLYSKRAMALEQLAAMRVLGYRSFALVSHDRGARIARRLALDHPECVKKLVVMDIIPAVDFYESANAAIAQDYFYFFFLTQPYPLPESLIAGNAKDFVQQILLSLSSGREIFDKAAFQLYLDAAARPEAIVAMCECFRAGVGLDRDHDEIDRRTDRKIICPTLVLWGEHGVIGKHFDVRRVWSRWCKDVRYAPMPCGHFIPEEAPEAALEELMNFL